MRLENLPLELLAHICLLAMDGDSHAASSLRLTSHTLCAAASIYRFHSIFVAGLISVQLLLDALAQVPNGTPRIEHLFICDKPSRHADDKLFRSRPTHNFIGDRFKESVGAQLRLANANEVRTITPLISRLLQFAAPTVQSITLMLFNSTYPGILSFFGSTPFPQMHVLSLRFPVGIRDPDAGQDELRMPALRHLNFNVDEISSVAREALEQIAQASPLLASVEIEGVQADSRLIQHLDRILAARETLDAVPEPWAFLEYSVYPVGPQSFWSGDLQRFYAEVKRILDLGLSGLEVHEIAARAPGFLEWSDEWKDMVAEEVFLESLGRL